MVINTTNRNINLKLSTKNVTKMLDSLKTDDIKALLFNGMSKMDAKILANIIQQLAEEKLTINDIYDFIDEYKDENSCSISKIYMELINEFNNNYFFDQKMNETEIEEIVKNPFRNTMAEAVNQALIEAAQKVATESIMTHAM